ncbi:g1657 [Coccomyxa elongata]
MSAAELKVIVLALYTLLFLGTLALIGLILWKNMVRQDSTWLDNNTFSKMSIGLATTCLTLLLCTLMWGSIRIWSVLKSGKHWGQRRRRLVALTFIQTLLQTVNVTFWLTPHVHILVSPCGWFKGKPVPLKPDPLILDAPLWYHAPKLLIWFVFQGTVIGEAVAEKLDNYNIICEAKSKDGACAPRLHTKIISIIWGALLVVYFVTYGYYKGRARIRLGKLPYNQFLTGNLLDSWQTRQGRWIMNFMVASVLTSWYFSWNRCSGYFTTWLGVFPLEIVVTGAMVANVLFMFPVPASKDSPGVQTLLQGFSWSEATREADLAHRNALLALHVKDAEKQPMFCLETAIKLLAFSWVVYNDKCAPAASESVGVCSHGRKNGKQKMDIHKKGIQSLEQGSADQVDIERGSHASTTPDEITKGELLNLALQFYDLQHTHIIHEEDPDTKVLIAWNKDTIVVAFRGTASLKNVLHDLQAWRAAHMPVRRHWWLGRRPMVHKGFWRSWSAHGVGDRVLEFLGKLLANSKLAPADWHVYLTGHSLGGALATLAAYDIQAAFGIKDLQVYTYGAPRTGNYAFARDYEELVQETWHVVHDADLIPRVGKFLRLYKRPGARVIVDRKGSIVVQPSPLELHLRPVRRSVKAHYLKSYQAALAEVLRVQFSPLKAFVGGRCGACTLANDPAVFSYLCSTGLDLVALSETDGHTGDTADSESVSETSEESASRMPDCLRTLMDRVFGTSLKSGIVNRAQGPGDDHEIVTGSFKDSTRIVQDGD